MFRKKYDEDMIRCYTRLRGVYKVPPIKFIGKNIKELYIHMPVIYSINLVYNRVTS